MIRAPFVKFRWMSIVATLLVGLMNGSTRLAAQARSGEARHSFAGVVIGIDVGWQNFIGGSLVSGVDVLQQGRRLVATASVGARVQTSFGAVFGADLGVGLTDGNLGLVDPSRNLMVGYRNRSQWHWNLAAGQTVGRARRDLVYLYLSEVARTFDVSVDAAGRRTAQRDEQGLLRYGLGYERAVSGIVSLRGSLGSSRAGFGGRQTNLVPRRVVDITVGAAVTP